MRQRTIENMKPEVKGYARHYWNIMQDAYDDREHAAARDKYHGLFRDDHNFLPNTEPYHNPN